jgi:hypothetical protein
MLQVVKSFIRKTFGTPGKETKDFNATLHERSLKKQIHDEKKVLPLEPEMHEEAAKVEEKKETLFDDRPLAAQNTISDILKPKHPFDRRDQTKRRQLTGEEVDQLQVARRALKDEK